TPSPPPISSQWLRSSDDAALRRCNCDSGTVTAEPSLKVAVIVSSENETCLISNSVIGQSSKFSIPHSQKFLQVYFRDPEDFIALVWPKTFHARKLKGIQPNLCRRLAALNMNVRRFITICRIKEKSITALAQNCWHSPLISTIIPSEVEESRYFPR